MIAYPDTSFLWAFYLKQSNSPAAAAYAIRMREPLHLTALLAYEFRQSLRFQVWRNAVNSREGITLPDAERAASQLQSDLSTGLALLAPADFHEVLQRAEDVSSRHTRSAGYRSFDILHVATALQLGVKEFLSFDSNQRKLAKAEGLRIQPGLS